MWLLTERTATAQRATTYAAGWSCEDLSNGWSYYWQIIELKQEASKDNKEKNADDQSTKEQGAK